MPRWTTECTSTTCKAARIRSRSKLLVLNSSALGEPVCKLAMRTHSSSSKTVQVRDLPLSCCCTAETQRPRETIVDPGTTTTYYRRQLLNANVLDVLWLRKQTPATRMLT